ncbi:hypothetical protein PGTUg99_033263 [Puccinia graminis f. sp. tritici]|uniref:Uncharacterized protein n=1 Tax=Puccinia graminis f. sp. tritici TaxID=56615 RepID=A0A5B0MHV4_PUCGR|nr:hypothetical protein PGTUg99_033263 [Puccinia graminis f. sp. tritici]
MVSSSSSEDSESDIQVTGAESQADTQKSTTITPAASQRNSSTPTASQRNPKTPATSHRNENTEQSSTQEADSKSNKKRKTTSDAWEHFTKKGCGM